MGLEKNICWILNTWVKLTIMNTHSGWGDMRGEGHLAYSCLAKGLWEGRSSRKKQKLLLCSHRLPWILEGVGPYFALTSSGSDSECGM